MSFWRINDPNRLTSFTANYMNGTYGNGIILDASGAIPNTFAINFRTNGNIRVQITDASSIVLNNLVANQLFVPNLIVGACSQLSNIVEGKNLIINGSCEIDQRFVGNTYIPTGDNLYTIDRWQARMSQINKFSTQKNAGSISGPTGFPHYLGITSLSAYTPLQSGDYFGIQQNIEGFNIAPLAWGTSSAKSVSLSFYVYSSLIGTFGGSLYNSQGTRCYPFSYSISSTNTWQYITIANIPGDSGAGYYDASYGTGLGLFFSLGCGSTYKGSSSAWGSTLYRTITSENNPIVSTNGAIFYITGVQLEIGNYCTTFSRAGGAIQQELALCQRYFWAMPNYNGSGVFNGIQYSGLLAGGNGPYSSAYGSFNVYAPLTIFNQTPMRAPPKIEQNPLYPLTSYAPFVTNFGSNVSGPMSLVTYTNPQSTNAVSPYANLYGFAPAGYLNFYQVSTSLTSGLVYGVNYSDPYKTLWLNSELYTNTTLATASVSGLTTTTSYLDQNYNSIGSAVAGGYSVLKVTGVGTGTLTTNFSGSIRYLAVGGGGGGGCADIGGGGGAGGFLTGTFIISNNTPYSISVGGGGAGGIAGTNQGNGNGSGANGGNTTLFGFTSLGGGGGASGNFTPSPSYVAGNGGSGGGAAWPGTYGSASIGSNTTGSYGIGFRGGTSSNTPGVASAGGGGGAGGQGQDTNGLPSIGGYGGPGLSSDITGTIQYYAGGGGADNTGTTAAPPSPACTSTNLGGIGGGGWGGNGNGSANPAPGVAYNASAGAANTGGGGGGCGGFVHSTTPAAGGSGIIILQYLSYQ
jgi:hypothetical protein